MFLFGKPVQGEPIGQPTFRTVMPPGHENSDFFEWAQQQMISSNYTKY